MFAMIAYTATYAVAEKPHEKEVLEIVKTDPITDIQIYGGKIYFFETTDSYKIFTDNSIEKVSGMPIIHAIIIFDDYEHNNGITDLSQDELMQLLENGKYTKKAKDGYLNSVDSITWLTEKTILFFSLFHKHDVSFNLQKTDEDDNKTYTAYAKIMPYNLWFPNLFVLAFMFWYLGIVLHMSDYIRRLRGDLAVNEESWQIYWSKFLFGVGFTLVLMFGGFFLQVIDHSNPLFKLVSILTIVVTIAILTTLGIMKRFGDKDARLEVWKNDLLFYGELAILVILAVIVCKLTLGYVSIHLAGYAALALLGLSAIALLMRREPYFKIIPGTKVAEDISSKKS